MTTDTLATPSAKDDLNTSPPEVVKSKIPEEKKPTEAKEPEGKEKFIRTMISWLTADRVEFYMRGERIYIDTAKMGGRGLMMLEGNELISFILGTAKKTDNLLLRSADAQLIVDHVRYHAAEVAKPLSLDNRAAHVDTEIMLNTGWKGDKLLVLKPEDGTWEERIVPDRIFEPLPPEMRMAVPVMMEAKRFPDFLKEGVADFGENHCLIAVTCATMLLPATFPHPFIAFTGDQARGKSTTMKLLLQLIDPMKDGELMTVGEDVRDLIALCRGRHCIALDNVTHLPFDEDLLSKMYSGGLFTARKMTTNDELRSTNMPRLRVMLNGIGTSFARSDLMSRCIFIEHPVLTRKNAVGRNMFQPLEQVEARWKARLPQTLGALLSAATEGWKLFLEEGGFEGKESECRYVEYCVIGECIAQVMGFPKGLFTKEVYRASELSEEKGVESDDCAQIVVAYLNGERGGSSQLAGWEEQAPLKTGINNGIIISSTDLYKAVREIAVARNYSVYSMKWMATGRAFSNAMLKSSKNIHLSGWNVRQIPGGEHKRKWEFTKI